MNPVLVAALAAAAAAAAAIPKSGQAARRHPGTIIHDPMTKHIVVEQLNDSWYRTACGNTLASPKADAYVRVKNLTSSSFHGMCSRCARSKVAKPFRPAPKAAPVWQTIPKRARVRLADGREGTNLATAREHPGSPNYTYPLHVRLDDGTRVRPPFNTVTVIKG